MALSLPAATLGAGALSAAGGILSGRSSAKAAERATKLQIAWERERAQNAHQWEVEDLKAAGLNPILSANGGATTGGISAPIPDTSGYAQAGNALSEAMKLAMEYKANEANVGLMGAQTANQAADTKNKMEQNKLLIQQTLSEMVKRGMISAQKANLELKNVEQMFKNEHQNLTYWNDFLNKASGTAKNVSDLFGLDKIIDKLVPKKDQKFVREEFGQGWKERTEYYNH